MARGPRTLGPCCVGHSIEVRNSAHVVCTARDGGSSASSTSWASTKGLVSSLTRGTGPISVRECGAAGLREPLTRRPSPALDIKRCHRCPVEIKKLPRPRPFGARNSAHGEWSCVVSGFIGANMQTRFSRRLAIVRERIEELEQIAPETVVVPNETRVELSELYAEAEYLEALAA